MNECVRCGLQFGSVSAFDRHRVGVYEYTFVQGLDMTPPREDGRRCLGADEMRELRDKNGIPIYALNDRGYWSLSAALESARSLRASE